MPQSNLRLTLSELLNLYCSDNCCHAPLPHRSRPHLLNPPTQILLPQRTPRRLGRTQQPPRYTEVHPGKRLFAESLNAGYTESFFPLAQQFITQGLPSSCASASMAMVLNALRIDPQVQWKGIWRWLDDYNIPHLQPEQLNEGLTLTQFHRLALQNRARSMAFVPNDAGVVLDNQEGLKISSLDFFRTAIASCSRRGDMFLTVNFHRKSLKQTGTGHYSPIAAYHAEKDMALVLDVAKFKYDSYWCSIKDLYAALKPIDQTSGLPRGFLINKREMQLESEARGAICSGGFDHSYNELLKERLA